MLDQKRDITLRHSQLQDKIDTFQKQAGSMLHAISNNADDSWGDDYAREVYTSAKFDGIGEEEYDIGLDWAAKAHHQMQILLSTLSDGCINVSHILLHLPSP